MVEMGVQAGDAEQVTPDRGGADLLGRGDPSTGEAALLSGEVRTHDQGVQAPSTSHTKSIVAPEKFYPCISFSCALL